MGGVIRRGSSWDTWNARVQLEYPDGGMGVKEKGWENPRPLGTREGSGKSVLSAGKAHGVSKHGVNHEREKEETLTAQREGL